jgi:hypothetical protein
MLCGCGLSRYGTVLLQTVKSLDVDFSVPDPYGFRPSGSGSVIISAYQTVKLLDVNFSFPDQYDFGHHRSGSESICTDPDPSIHKEKNQEKRRILLFIDFLMTYYL